MIYTEVSEIINEWPDHFVQSCRSGCSTRFCSEQFPQHGMLSESHTDSLYYNQQKRCRQWKPVLFSLWHILRAEVTRDFAISEDISWYWGFWLASADCPDNKVERINNRCTFFIFNSDNFLKLQFNNLWRRNCLSNQCVKLITPYYG